MVLAVHAAIVVAIAAALSGFLGIRWWLGAATAVIAWVLTCFLLGVGYDFFRRQRAP